MSRIWDALTVAQDDVMQQLASLSAFAEEKPANGSFAEVGQSTLPQESELTQESERFPELDRFAAEHGQSLLQCAVNGIPAQDEAHPQSDGERSPDDEKLESFFLTEDAPRPAVSEEAQPGAAVFQSTPRTGMLWAALIAATVLIAFSALAGVQVRRARSALLRQHSIPKPAATIPENRATVAPLPVAKPGSGNNTLKPPAHAQKLVVVERNQTLAGISMVHLGEYNPAVLAKLRELNPSLRNPDHIEVGQQIRLPVAIERER